MDTIDHTSNQLSPTTGNFPSHRLSWDLALRTQGLSEYDLTMLVKNEIEDSFLLNLFSETKASQSNSLPSPSTLSPPLVHLSARKLLNASYCDLQPTSAELLTWPDDDVAGSHPVPVVLGLEDIRKQLLSWTIGCIPSQRKTADRSHSLSSFPLPQSQSQSQSSSLDSNALKSLFKIRPCSGAHTAIVMSGMLSVKVKLNPSTTQVSSSAVLAAAARPCWPPGLLTRRDRGSNSSPSLVLILSIRSALYCYNSFLRSNFWQ